MRHCGHVLFEFQRRKFGHLRIDFSHWADISAGATLINIFVAGPFEAGPYEVGPFDARIFRSRTFRGRTFRGRTFHVGPFFAGPFEAGCFVGVLNIRMTYLR